jgi:tetratricopeptide (TPR) repeat protein
MPYHLVNIGLHALNGLLLFVLLRRLGVAAAWLAALVWLLHPVNVESVAWITELKNTQSGCFFLLAMLCFFRFDADGTRRWYALALLCGLAAMLSKPSTVILPLALLLAIWWNHRQWRPIDVRRVAPFFLLALAMSVLTVIEQRGQILRQETADWNLAPAERVLIAGRAVWFYAFRLLWPVRLTFVYPHWNLQPRSPLSWLPVAGLAALALALWLGRQQPWARAGIFGGGFFVAALLPVLGFFDIFYFRYSFVADHFQYLASMGLLALITASLTAACRPFRRRPVLIAASTAALLLLLAMLTWKHGLVFRNAQSLWRDTLAKNPQCWMAHTNLGNLLQNSGQIAEAQQHYLRALQIKPDYPTARNDLAVSFLAEGKTEAAMQELEQALRTTPDSTEARDNLAWLLATLPPSQGGDPARAIQLARQSCQLTGYRDPARLNTLAVADAAAGQFADAIQTAQRALDLAHAAGQSALAGEIESRLESYRSQPPARRADTPSPTSP